MKRKIKLAGIDLDGTLLNDEKQLCEGAAKSLKAAAESGIELVPITGRPFNGIPSCVKKLDFIRFAIASNGAQIIDFKTGKSIFSYSMTNEKSIEVFELLEKSGAVFEPFADGVCYTEQRILDSYLSYFKGSPIEEYLLSTRVICDSIKELFTVEGKQADEFFVSCQNSEIREKITEQLDEIGGVQYWFYDNKYIEITREGCDKGAALEALCSYLEINPGETIAFGDGDNDVLMLKKAGVAVAMGNAFQSVKDCADIVADTNNDNGVAKILENI